jgi:hypothetical protein
MINDETLEHLEDDVKLGDNAQTAYDLYLKRFIELQQEHAWQAFKDLQASNIDGLQTCKFLNEAIMHLEEAILQDIASGRLAKIQLGENND